MIGFPRRATIRRRPTVCDGKSAAVPGSTAGRAAASFHPRARAMRISSSVQPTTALPGCWRDAAAVRWRHDFQCFPRIDRPQATGARCGSPHPRCADERNARAPARGVSAAARVPTTSGVWRSRWTTRSYAPSITSSTSDPSRSAFRTADGSKFHAMLINGNAAFEIDGIEPGSRTGWSVIIVGMTEEVTTRASSDASTGWGSRRGRPGTRRIGCGSAHGR